MRWVTISIALLIAVLWRPAFELLRGYASAPIQQDASDGATLFATHNLNALNTDTVQTVALPWRLVAAALTLTQDGDLRTILGRFGFLFPERIGNWPSGGGTSETPLGVTIGVASRSLPQVRLTIANLGCASCHSGVTYDATGTPRPTEAWLGLPNTSLDLEAYTNAIYTAFKATLDDPERLIATVKTLFPDTHEDELATLRSYVIPAAAERIKVLEAGLGRALPFSNGAPGLTNGVAALKLQMALLDPAHPVGVTGFTSIPDLADRTWRSALLYDGAYAPPGAVRWRVMKDTDRTLTHRNALADVATFFTVPSMGQSPERARDLRPVARTMFEFLESYRPPKYPGPIDRARAIRGRDVYTRSCAACHGTYDDSLEQPRLTAFPNWRGDVGTDRNRAEAMNPRLAEAIDRSRYRDIIDAEATGVYAAPLLSGLWATAPYLHNGSVPTLAQLLDLSPRPARFLAGGHRLDFQEVGIAGTLSENGVYEYPSDWVPWSRPGLIDTAADGFSNIGHSEQNRDLSENERRDLLEYLKLL